MLVNKNNYLDYVRDRTDIISQSAQPKVESTNSDDFCKLFNCANNSFATQHIFSAEIIFEYSHIKIKSLRLILYLWIGENYESNSFASS